MVCGLLVSAAQAEVYRWVDADGQVHFSDVKPDSSTGAKTMDIPLVNSVPAIASEEKPEQPQQPASSTGKKVVIYTTEWCGYCKKAREYFIANKIAFKEKDIEKSRKYKSEYKALGGGSIPLFAYKGKTLRGFSEYRFMKFYDRLTHPEGDSSKPAS